MRQQVPGRAAAAALDPAGPLSIRIGGPRSETLGFLEIDRVVAGRCCGGVRMTAALSAEEVRRLARVMTLKCGYLGLAAGGAKAGVVAGPGAGRAECLEAFGRGLAPVLRSGVYSFGCDLGTTPADIAAIRRGAGMPGAGRPGGDVGGGGESGAAGGGATSGEYAGLTVALAAVAALRARGIDPRGARAAIQGAGAVGRALMALLEREGVRVVAVATALGTLVRPDGLDVQELLAAAALEGDAFVVRAGARAPEAVLAAPCDVLIPCAGSGTIDVATARRVPAAIVVSGANDPFATGAEDALIERRVLVVPDFVANGGGVLGSTLAGAGAGPAEVESLIRRRFAPKVAATLAEAAARGEPVAGPAARRALRFLDRCDRAYGHARPPSLLPEALAPGVGPARRVLLAIEARARGSRRLAPLARRLRPAASGRLDQILSLEDRE